MLLLAATEVAAFAGQEITQDRKQLIHKRINPFLAAHPPRPRLETQQQVFLNGELGNDFAPLGHVAHTGAGPLMGRLPIEALLSEIDLTAARLKQTNDAFEQGGFADAIAADQAHHLAGIHGEVHIPQDVALAVVGVQGANLELFHHISSWVPR